MKKVLPMSPRFMSLVLTAFLSTHALAMGQQAQVFENSTAAGIWDHGSDFYLRLDIAELADLKDQKFVWAGFQEVSTGQFSGEVVADDFGKGERRFPARATLLSGSQSARFFHIEVLGSKGEVIKEIFVKGPSGHFQSTR